MHKRIHSCAPVAVLALAMAAATDTASADQIRYELQGVFDQSDTPVALIGGFTYDTDTSSFLDITVRFDATEVLGVTPGVFDQSATLYHYATDQFVAYDGLGNAVVLNIDGVFSLPGNYVLTQTGDNSISYALLELSPINKYDIVNGNVSAVPEPEAWSLWLAGAACVSLCVRRRVAG